MINYHFDLKIYFNCNKKIQQLARPNNVRIICNPDESDNFYKS